MNYALSVFFLFLASLGRAGWELLGWGIHNIYFEWAETRPWLKRWIAKDNKTGNPSVFWLADFEHFNKHWELIFISFAITLFIESLWGLLFYPLFGGFFAFNFHWTLRVHPDGSWSHNILRLLMPWKNFHANE